MKLNNGFVVSMDSLDDPQQYFINFDRDGEVGGYINIHFDDRFVYYTVMNGNGDLIREDSVSFESLEPTGHFGNVEDVQ